MTSPRLASGFIGVLWLCTASPAMGQVHTGDLRLRVTDSAGLGLKASVTVASGASQYHNVFETSAAGEVDVKSLPYGIYLVSAEKAGFAPNAGTVEVRTSSPTMHTLKLVVAAVATSVDVNGQAPLIDPYRPSSVMQIGSAQIRDRVGSLPGRSVQDLVNSQPGWLYEGNAVLHPRGSEYQTQFVIDGIPLTDNRSPSFGPEIEADDL